MKNKKGKIIAFTSQSGNVMKSTLVQACAVKLTKLGVNCKVACLDVEHRTAYEHLKERHESGISKDPNFPLFNLVNANNAKHAIESYNNEEIYIIDLPSRAGVATLEIAKVADHIIMPTCSGIKDLKLTMETAYQLVESGIPGKKITFIITRVLTKKQVNKASQYLNQCKKYDPRFEFNVLRTSIKEMASYHEAIDNGFTILETLYGSVNDKAEIAIDRILKSFLTQETIEKHNITLLKQLK